VTYYIDAVHGSDTSSGQSPKAAWRTLSRVDEAALRGDDRVLLRAGQRFSGTLKLSSANLRAVDRRHPLAIGSYGRGHALIAPRRGSGIVATNVSGVRVSGLDIAGRGRGCHGSRDGIFFDARDLHGSLGQGITIAHVIVHGFCDGIVIGSDDDSSRIAHVSISSVRAYDNADAGIFTYDQSHRRHEIRDVVIQDVQAYDNNQQGGIVLFGVDSARVTHSVAYGNGRGASGAVGIWAFDATRVMFDHDESYRNLTVGDDGDGFDLDAGVTNSVMEYDYSHDNAGIGFLVCSCDTSYYAERNDVIRYDVSQNDGRSGQASSVYVGGGQPVNNVEIYNNSFYSATRGEALVVLDGDGSPTAGIHARNNLLVAGGHEPLLYVDTAEASGLEIQGNDWWSASGRFLVKWGALRFRSLGVWRALTGVERLGSRPVGLSADPQACRIGDGATMFPRPPAALRAYRLRRSSPLLAAALDLRQFGIRAGTAGFEGRTRGAHDIGAVQGSGRGKC
jgi:hypothetical protein